MLKQRRLHKTLLLLILMVCHVLWLSNTSRYITPELIFPVWLLTNAKTFVSEINSFYPPIIFYFVSILNNFTNNLQQSFYLIQLIFVLVIDLLLFHYLKSRFKFKLAVIGFLFYIPWQIYFRGNYLWFDLATIPFLLLSFSFFEIFLTNFKLKEFLLASTFLSLGYLFKNTVLWIYVLYSIWIAYLTFMKFIKVRDVIKYLFLLVAPLIIAIAINFVILLSKSTFEFTFYWHIFMQNIIYPRMSTFQRGIERRYLLPLILILAIFIVSCFVIERYSKLKRNSRLFIYSYSLVSFANIFPRWSDFHVQPFLVFLTIVVTYAISLSNNLTKAHKLFLKTFTLIILFLSLTIFANRIFVERKNMHTSTTNYINEFAPIRLTSLIENKNIFVYDFPLYNGEPINTDKEQNPYSHVDLAIKNPDKYYHLTNSQIALNYVKARNPDIIIVPYQIQNRLEKDSSLTTFEKLVKQKYINIKNISNIYFIYIQKID